MKKKSNILFTTQYLPYEDFSLKISDTISIIAFNTDIFFGPRKENIFETLSVVSSRKEQNSIILHG